MTAVVLARPPLLPQATPRVNLWHSLRYVWIGWDGSRWDLTDGPIFLTAAGGFDGLDIPTTQEFVTDYALIDGQGWDGGRYRAGVKTLALMCSNSVSSEAFLHQIRPFYRSVLPGKPGTLQVIDPMGGHRSMTLHRVSDGSQTVPDIDPALVGQYAFILQLQYDDPSWFGEPITRGWSAVTGHGMFYKGWITVTSNADYQSATLTNLSDKPAPVSYHIEDQIGSGSYITLAGRKLGLTAVTAGQTLDVVTDPRDPHAILTDTDGSTSDVTGECVPWAQHLLPVGETVPVDINIASGSGWKIQASAPSRYLTPAF